MARLPTTPIQRAAARASKQRGLLTLRQAVAAGLSNDQVERATAIHGWKRLARGLYALPGSSRSWQRDVLAGVLLAGDESVASDLTAAALWCWSAPPVLPDVTVPPSQSNDTKLARIHRRTVPNQDKAVRDGVRCTSASRTLVDCAAIVARERLELFVDDALCAKVATSASIRAAADRAGRRGRRGITNLDAVLAVWTEDIRPDSPAEMRVLRRLTGLGLVGLVTQHEVYDEDGAFVGRLDIAAPERRQGFEYDSDRWHNPRHFGRDEPRYAWLQALGWTIDPVCKLDLLPTSTRLKELVTGSALTV